MTVQQLLEGFRSLKPATRVSILVLLGVLGLGAAAVYAGETTLEAWQAEESGLSMQVRSTRAETTTLRNDIQFVQDNTARYERSLARGIFAERRRLFARRTIEALLVANRLQGGVSVLPREREGPFDVADQKYDILRAPVEIDVHGMLDADVFSFLRDSTSALPGYVVFTGMRLERQPVVTQEDLRELASGRPMPLVGARITLDWRSARPSGSEEVTQ